MVYSKSRRPTGLRHQNREAGGRQTVQRITREQARKYTFDWRDEPLLRVKPGERFDQMCRVGKLSYVAGAELPKRYLA